MGLGLLLASGCSSDHATDHDTGGSGTVTGDVSCSDDERVDAFSAGTSKDGKRGALSFDLVESDPAPPSKGDNTFTLRVTDSEGEPAEVSLEVLATMPDHGHDSPSVPEISFDEAQQAFTVTPLDLFMAGVWRIDFSARATDDEQTALDDVSFFFCVEG